MFTYMPYFHTRVHMHRILQHTCSHAPHTSTHVFTCTAYFNTRACVHRILPHDLNGAVVVVQHKNAIRCETALQARAQHAVLCFERTRISRALLWYMRVWRWQTITSGMVQLMRMNVEQRIAKGSRILTIHTETHTRVHDER
jgi:hypothetical protein